MTGNNVVVYDSGNGLWKAKIAGGERAIRHALMPLSDTEYEKVVRDSRGKPPEGYARINGEAVAYGIVAEKRGADRKTGASRYNKRYYGHSLAIMLNLLYEQSGEVLAFCSYAPRDSEYENDVVKAAIGEYYIEVGESKKWFKVNGATTFPEPVGGLMNVMLRQDGMGAQTVLTGGDSLVIDIGEFTTDFVSVDQDGVVDQVLNTSERIGIQEVVRTFEDSLRAAYKDEFKDTVDFKPHKIRKAIRMGVYEGGGREYECNNIAREAGSNVLTRIAAVYQSRAGGPGNWDNIILTGGGSAMLYDRLVEEVLNHGRVFIADNDFEALHLANVRGGLKLWRFYESVGAV
jgi:hypothetical protein